MNTKSKLSIFTAVAAALITFACLGGTPATSTPVESTEAPIIPTEHVLPKDGKLEITNTSSYVDAFNDYNVVGEIVNNTNKVIENVTLSIAITDASGATLLKDDDDNPVERLDIWPYITVLAPGASTPFNYYISADEVQPAAYDVTLKSYDPSSAPGLNEFDIQNVQTNFVGDDVIITGEVVNLSPEQIDVEALAGALLDEKGNVLAANSTLTYARYLYPTGDLDGRDRGPFIVKLFGPIQNVNSWKVYARSVKSTTVPDTAMDVQLTGSYLDAYGTYHLLGTVTNHGSSQIKAAVISDLYNADQAVLDVASLNIPTYLNTGESVPFDINTFQVISSLTTEDTSSAKTMARPDLYWTYASDYEIVPLDKSTLKLSGDNSSWTAAGTITNTSNAALNSITALIQCRDAKDQLLAVNYTSMYPVEGATSIQPGETAEFSMDLYPPADTEQLNNCNMSFQGIGAE